jgi:hypothetical protein
MDARTEQRLSATGMKLTPMLLRDLELCRAEGMEPAWTRVWRNGRDVTDEDPSTWPWPWHPDKKPGQR